MKKPTEQLGITARKTSQMANEHCSARRESTSPLKGYIALIASNVCRRTEKKKCRKDTIRTTTRRFVETELLTTKWISEQGFGSKHRGTLSKNTIATKMLSMSTS